MQNIKILYLFFKKKIIFENLLVGPPKLEGPRLQSILAYRIIRPSKQVSQIVCICNQFFEFKVTLLLLTVCISFAL